MEYSHHNLPKVSIVIPTKNRYLLLYETVNSIRKQTYTNWESIIVDDGSTDNSTAIAREYAANYPTKIRYLEHDNHQNRGTCASRNLAVRNARGEYIALLDADERAAADSMYVCVSRSATDRLVLDL